MSELTLQRIPFTTEADNRLRLLKSRTGITPNILCRLGFCLSLEEVGVPELLPEDYKQGREINRYTLLGKDDLIYVSLLLVRLQRDNISLDKVNDMFLAHVHRGIELLSARVKNVSNVGTLCQLTVLI
ncbi:MAG TPA: DNA sulfur modification protein DndE [Gammaproteobacteria bacterium]|nr:DNA sulfur modification protein DndE [Gammaproteobacteria bacterium]